MAVLDRVQHLAARAVGQPVALAGLGVYRSEGPALNTGLITGPTLTLVLDGAKSAALGDRMLDYAAGQYLVVTVDLPMTSQVVTATVERPFLAIGLPLRATLLTELLVEEAPRAPAPSAPAAGVSRADDALLGAFERLLRMRAGSAEATALAPGIEREIHWRLLNGPQGASLRALGTAGGRLEGVVRAIEWIRGHLDEVLRVEDVARAAHMSVATLNRHFTAVTDLTPLRYQKLLRLHEARLRLVSSGRNVAAIGYEVGYGSRSQFTREYTRLFGRPPGLDSAALRGAGSRDTAVHLEPPRGLPDRVG